MAGVTPYNIHVGHDQVKSDVNLPRCMRWLGELAESQPREARRVQLALSITIHADQEERARAPVTDTRREGERLETQQPDRTA